MATTLSYGFVRPAEGDLASVWMDALEDNVTQLNSHDHDGTDSALIAAASISKYTTTIASTGYTSLGNGNYSKVITVPAAITEINSYLVQFYITATGVRVWPSVERASATSYTIYLNQQLALTAVYI